METVNFTEFRKNASELFTKVEQGEIIHVIRHGKAIATIMPIENETITTPSWKQPAVRLSQKGSSLSKAIIEERNESDQ